MSGAEALPWWAAVPVALLLVLGGLVTVIGALGLARLQSFYQRIHGPAITVTLGAGCILLASMLYFSVAQSRLVIHEVLISLFVLMTAPVVAMLIMRAAVYRDLRERSKTSTRPADRLEPGSGRAIPGVDAE
ncbi:monovalent cation/H(+) antiporter subunit G [Rhodoferax sp. U2-2l]|uniref:monovalent cation/H(+) antiporter subunit G n=1 Tax=Rhodoferax sp. U2-2l TaxID=2884000 RepID=UPI001D0A73EA|nr:monovalent cation/H(+) antiporter subunit G [Rhodoferax sp. U2-2l]MCB8745363.1 monovalent cation/H(+) antiporter subunit G [Rhodoferax sp. U2-2l]